MPKVRFEREDVIVDVKSGTTVLEAAEQAGIDVFRGMWAGLHCKRVHGWCNRCKVWVKSDSPQAVNAPTSAERFPLRMNGRVVGTLRLACQATVAGDVSVHTRAGGPTVKKNANWEASPEPTKWKERWEKRHDKGGGSEGEASAD